MDSTTQAIVTEIVSRKIAENWLYWLLYLAAIFLAAFLSPYIKRRAENLATRDDFEELKGQLAQNTRVTEEIKAEIGHAEWKSREVNALLRTKLEEFAQCISSSDQAFSAYVRKSCGGEYLAIDIPDFDRLRALATLYFPDFLEAVGHYSVDAQGTMLWSMQRAIAVAASKQAADVERHAAEMRTNIEEFKTRIPPHNQWRDKLETMASARMKELIEIDR